MFAVFKVLQESHCNIFFLLFDRPFGRVDECVNDKYWLYYNQIFRLQLLLAREGLGDSLLVSQEGKYLFTYLGMKLHLMLGCNHVDKNILVQEMYLCIDEHSFY